MKKLEECPTCGRKITSSWFGGVYFDIYQCKKCTYLYCYKCGTYGEKCPSCGSKEKRKIAEVWRVK